MRWTKDGCSTIELVLCFCEIQYIDETSLKRRPTCENPSVVVKGHTFNNTNATSQRARILLSTDFHSDEANKLIRLK